MITTRGPDTVDIVLETYVNLFVTVYLPDDPSRHPVEKRGVCINRSRLYEVIVPKTDFSVEAEKDEEGKKRRRNNSMLTVYFSHKYHTMYEKTIYICNTSLLVSVRLMRKKQ